MDTQCATVANPEYTNSGALGSARGDKLVSDEEEEVEEDKEDQKNKNGKGGLSTPAQNNPLEHKTQTQSSALAQWACNSEGETKINKIICGCVKMQILHFSP